MGLLPETWILGKKLVTERDCTCSFWLLTFPSNALFHGQFEKQAPAAFLGQSSHLWLFERLHEELYQSAFGEWLDQRPIKTGDMRISYHNTVTCWLYTMKPTWTKINVNTLTRDFVVLINSFSYECGSPETRWTAGCELQASSLTTLSFPLFYSSGPLPWDKVVLYRQSSLGLIMA